MTNILDPRIYYSLTCCLYNGPPDTIYRTYKFPLFINSDDIEKNIRDFKIKRLLENEGN